MAELFLHCRWRCRSASDRWCPENDRRPRFARRWCDPRGSSIRWREIRARRFQNGSARLRLPPAVARRREIDSSHRPTCRRSPTGFDVRTTAELRIQTPGLREALKKSHAQILGVVPMAAQDRLVGGVIGGRSRWNTRSTNCARKPGNAGSADARRDSIADRAPGPRAAPGVTISRKYSSSSVPEKIFTTSRVSFATSACRFVAQIPARELVLPGVILKLRDGALIDGLDFRAHVVLFQERGHGVVQSRIGGVAIDLAPVNAPAHRACASAKPAARHNDRARAHNRASGAHRIAAAGGAFPAVRQAFGGGSAPSGTSVGAFGELD